MPDTYEQGETGLEGNDVARKPVYIFGWSMKIDAARKRNLSAQQKLH